MKNLYFLSLICMVITFVSCKSDDDIREEIAEENEQTILDYLTANNLTAERTESGLYYIIDNPGTNERPSLSSIVEVTYKGYFVDGVEFDATGQGETIEFPLSNVIAGWREGIQLFGKGGSGVLLIPSALAYGQTGFGPIPPNEVIIFDINLIDFFGTSEEEIAAVNEQTILDYLTDNNLSAEKTESGLYYIIDNPGSNDRPSLSSTVEVTYKGYFVDGVEFDGTAPGATIDFPLTNVIVGWQEGLQLFGKGGSGVLLIPSALAYGTSGSGSIPPNKVILFDISLIDFF